MPNTRRKRQASRKTEDLSEQAYGLPRTNSVPINGTIMCDSPTLSYIPPHSDFTSTSSPTKPVPKPTRSTPSQKSPPNRAGLRSSTATSVSSEFNSTNAPNATKAFTEPCSSSSAGSNLTPLPAQNGLRNSTTNGLGDPSSPSSLGLPSSDQALAEKKKEAGNVKFRLKQFSEAIMLYTEAVKLDPTNAAYLTNRAAALMALKRYEPAVADMQLATSGAFSQCEPDAKPSSKNLLRLVRCYVALGQLFQARQALTNLFEGYPSLPEGTKEAERLSELEATLQNIQNHRSRNNWSMVLFGLDALQRNVEGGTLVSKEWIGWKVEALCAKKRWREAQTLATDLVRNHPSDPEALYHRALVMYFQGNLSATISHSQEALRCDPDFTKARDLLRQSRSIETAKELGNSAFKVADYSKANKLYIKAAAIDPANEAITLILDSNRAQSLYKLKRCAEAIEVCNTILNIDDKHFKALRTRARAQVLESEFDAAITDFHQAANNAPSQKDKTELLQEIHSVKIKLSKSKFKNHYEVLGVCKNASDDEIKKAFRKQSLIHHPDKGGNEEKFKEINAAYTVLQNPTTRRQFDMGNLDDPGTSCNYEDFGSGLFDFSREEIFNHTAYMNSRRFGGGGSSFSPNNDLYSSF